jgi:glycosyltransferase involved in cell wall biosynthesis
MPDRDGPVVLHVTPSLATGGAERVLTSLVTTRRDTPFRQVVVDLKANGAHAAAIRAAGVPLHEFGVRNPLALPFAVFRLAALIHALRPVAIQSWLHYADLVSLWALERSGLRDTTRFYWGVRASDLDLSHYSFALRWTVKACARRSARPDAVVANSLAGREVHRSWRYRPRAFPVIPNGIDTDLFRPDPAARARIRAELKIPDDATVAIHAARVDPMKDHASLIAIACALPEVRFVIVGAGTEALDVPANVTPLGLRTDLPALNAAADLALSTSAFGEGFPNVVGEAMAAGLPVLATDVGDARLIVGDTGVIVPSREPASSIKAVRELLSHPADRRHRMGAAARERIQQHFSIGRMVAAFDALHLHGTLPPDPQI